MGIENLSSIETLATHKPRFYGPPKNPETIVCMGIPMVVYLGPEILIPEVDHFIDLLSPLQDFEAILPNNNGGGWLTGKTLARHDRTGVPIVPIEYHRNKGGFSCSVTTRVPEHLRRKRVLIIDDVYDSGGTAMKMKEDTPNATMIFVLRKTVEGQLLIPDAYWAFEANDTWFGGAGMRLTDDPEKVYIRRLNMLVAKGESIKENFFVNPFKTINN